MSYENPNFRVTGSSYNVPIDAKPINESSELLDLSSHPLLDEYEPVFRPLVLSGLAAIHWACQQNPDLLSASPLNNLSYPPIHPDFERQAAALNKEGGLAAQAGAAVLAVTLAYQTWMHSIGAGVRTISNRYQQYETSVKQDINEPRAQQTAGDILYHPGFAWEVTDLSAQHVVNGGSAGMLRLSATVLRIPKEEEDDSSLGSQTPQAKLHYFLNLSTSFHGFSVAGRPGWATARVEGGRIDQERFASIDDGVDFKRLTKLAQVLNSLVYGEAYLADVPPFV